MLTYLFVFLFGVVACMFTLFTITAFGFVAGLAWSGVVIFSMLLVASYVKNYIKGA